MMASRRAAVAFTSLATPASTPFVRSTLSQKFARPCPLSSQMTIAPFRSFHSPRRRPEVLYVSPLLRAVRLRYNPSTSRLTLRTSADLSHPLPRRRSRVVRFLYRTFTVTGFIALSIGSFVVLFFLYDASTYNEQATHFDVPVPEPALNPRRGGPKNLPIIDCLLDDSDSPQKEAQRDKPKLVILGGGWGVSTREREVL